MQNKRTSNDLIHQYDTVSGEYASLTEIDPVKRFVQYPEALRLLADVNHKKILDIGCGNGVFTRMLARLGARVVGYDPSVRQIEEAKKAETQEKLGIAYYVSDLPPAGPDYTFDNVVSVMVLLYAIDRKQLQDIFSYARRAVTKGGTFSSITFNPNFKRFGEIAYNRRFSKTNDGKIQVEFFDEHGNVKMSATFSDFSVLDYKRAAKEAGFTDIQWETLVITPEGLKAKGSAFWKRFETDPPYIGINVTEK